ncbi:MAG: hypothetical protein JSR33_03385 [Proteobacteria bacterium]|nr:hypothetical protein [Pseudomonadota bacterium]
MPRKRKGGSQPEKSRPSSKKTKIDESTLESTVELTPLVGTDEAKKLLKECILWDEEKYNQLSDYSSMKHYVYYRTVYNRLGNLKTGAAAVSSKFVDPASDEVEYINYILSITAFACAATVAGIPVAITLETAKLIINKISARHKANQATTISYILDDINRERAFNDNERQKTAFNCVVRYWEAIERLTVRSAELVAELAVERIKEYLIKHGLIAEALKERNILLSSQFPVAINIMKNVGGRKRKLVPEFKIYREMYSHSFYDLGGIKVNAGSHFRLYLSGDEEIKSSASKYLFRIGTQDEAKLFKMKLQKNIPDWYQFSLVPRMRMEIDTLTKLCGQLSNSLRLLEMQQWQKSLTMVNTGTMILSDKAFQEWFDFLFAQKLQESFDKSKSSESTLEEEDLAEQLAREAKKGGLVCQNVSGFGNCFFNAFAHQLYVLEGRDASCKRDDQGVIETQATEERAAELRNMAAKEVKDHWDEYQHLFHGDKKEADKIARPGIWVDETAVLMLVNAFARQGRYLTVVLITHDSEIMQVFRAPGSIEVINLGCEIGRHYQSLMAKDKKAIGQPTKQQTNEERSDPIATKNVKQTLKLVTKLHNYQKLHSQKKEDKHLEQKIKEQLEIVYPNEPGVNADIVRNIKFLEGIDSKNATQELELRFLKSICEVRSQARTEPVQPALLSHQGDNRPSASSQVSSVSFMPPPPLKNGSNPSSVSSPHTPVTPHS